MMITVRNLVKIFRRRKPANAKWIGKVKHLLWPTWEKIAAVNDVSFTIQTGEIIGYIGMNGAGKSTTIKCLTGILVPSAGSVEVAGLVPHRQRVKNSRNIGVVFGQKSQLWWDVPPRATYDVLRTIWGLSSTQYRKQITILNELLELSPFIDVPVRQLSLGQRMRADLAAALLHDPPILFLDEPTIGMDFDSKDRFRRFIARINQERNVTVFLATHDLEDINKLASRLLIIDNGTLVYEGSIAEVKQRYVPFRIVKVELIDKNFEIELPNEIKEIYRDRNRLYLQFPLTMTAKNIADSIDINLIKDFTIGEPSIEDVVRVLNKRNIK